ncbi:MAG TPA: TadE/TadG family type IV pilus assembly protein [Candidatus Binatia bacterium]|nr:TadE/TadG family type IV pilus assembly protein [Candidatus Binatia bacterium]
MRVIRHRMSRDEGVAAVEFALILPVLALLLFGILEFGRVWSQYQVFQGAAREGARCAGVQATEFSECEIQPAIDQAAAPYDPEGDAAVEIDGGSAPAGCTDDDQGNDVQVSWEQPLDINIPFWNDVTVTPTIKAVFRCE